MRTTVRKWFWVWDFDKEEAWLNQMAAKGLSLVSVGFCRYDFEDSAPGEYGIRLELLENLPSHPESVKYIDFLEETGAQHVGSFVRWIYLRKKKSDGEFELFSDNDSRIKHLTRILRFVGLITGLNIYIGLYNLFLYFTLDSGINIMGFINLLIGVFGSVGFYKLYKKRNRLKNEQRLYE